MDNKELFEYIKNRKYFCNICYDLKQKVMSEGIEVLKDYHGLICGSVEDMLIRYSEIER